MGLLGLVTTGAGHAWDPARHCSAVMATPPMVRATPTSAVATVMTRTPSHWLGLGLELGLGLG